jgi:hypothetical protein
VIGAIRLSLARATRSHIPGRWETCLRLLLYAFLVEKRLRQGRELLESFTYHPAGLCDWFDGLRVIEMPRFLALAFAFEFGCSHGQILWS